MSTLKTGDRVKVAFEGTVLDRRHDRCNPTVDIDVDGVPFAPCWIDESFCTVLAAPVKVGDTLTTAEELDALPRQSVVTDCDGDVWTKGFGGDWWYMSARSPANNLADGSSPLVVIYLGTKS